MIKELAWLITHLLGWVISFNLLFEFPVLAVLSMLLNGYCAGAMMDALISRIPLRIQMRLVL